MGALNVGKKLDYYYHNFPLTFQRDIYQLAKQKPMLLIALR